MQRLERHKDLAARATPPRRAGELLQQQGRQIIMSGVSKNWRQKRMNELKEDTSTGKRGSSRSSGKILRCLMQGWFCGRRSRGSPRTKRDELTQRNKSLTRRWRHCSEQHISLKRRRQAYFAWKSVNSLVQQWCLQDLGLTDTTNQVTEEKTLGRLGRREKWFVVH